MLRRLPSFVLPYMAQDAMTMISQRPEKSRHTYEFENRNFLNHNTSSRRVWEYEKGLACKSHVRRIVVVWFYWKLQCFRSRYNAKYLNHSNYYPCSVFQNRPKKRAEDYEIATHLRNPISTFISEHSRLIYDKEITLIFNDIFKAACHPAMTNLCELHKRAANLITFFNQPQQH